MVNASFGINEEILGGFDMKLTFSKKTLDAILEDISEFYFEDGNLLGLWEVMEYVKSVYKDEIDTLDDESVRWDK